jgi:8-oxo-dGTP pyrophosphatase MutT (NUDIX family)
MPKDQPFAVNVSSSEVALRGMIWNVQREVFEFADQTLTREFVDHPGAVAIVAMNDRGQVLLIRQYRHPVGELLWEIPAGLLDVDGESLESAARRELLEETGYLAGELEPLIEFFTTPGGSTEKISIFLARDLVLSKERPKLEGEEVDMLVEWVALEVALTSVLSSEIKSPSAAVGIMAAALRGRA